MVVRHTGSFDDSLDPQRFCAWYTRLVRNLAMTANEKDLKTWDGILAFWVVFWFAMGVATAAMIWGLSGLAQSAVQSGQALNSAGEALESLSAIPVIGEAPAAVGTQVRETASGIVTNGQQAEARLHVLAILLGVAVAVLPITPVIGFYVPVRVARRRDVQEIRAALKEGGLQEQVTDYLSQRALDNLSFAEVQRATTGTDGSPTERSYRLAMAELHRLGLRPPPRTTG